MLLFECDVTELIPNRMRKYDIFSRKTYNYSKQHLSYYLSLSRLQLLVFIHQSMSMKKLKLIFDMLLTNDHFHLMLLMIMDYKYGNMLDANFGQQYLFLDLMLYHYLYLKVKIMFNILKHFYHLFLLIINPVYVHHQVVRQ